MRAVLAAIFAGLAGAMVCTPASAQFTAGEIVEDCVTTLLFVDFNKWVHPENKMEDAVSHGMCFGFIDSAWQSTPGPNEPNNPRHLFEACFPAQLERKQLVKSFVLYMQKRKDLYGKPALLVAQEAFSKTYPCKK